MKLDKKQALILSNVLFAYKQTCKYDDVSDDVYDIMNLLQDFLLSPDECAHASSTEDEDEDGEETDENEVPETSDGFIFMQDLHDLPGFGGVEFEWNDGSLSVLVDGYNEFDDVTAVKRTPSTLEVYCEGKWSKQNLPKKDLPSKWKKLLPSGKVLLTKDSELQRGNT